ncbi:polycystin-2-like [Branchiostoma lanceolatum]|uniref:polycystin-2-like n=1 Tax=Branchiostoma lanceolatum TaxID=7740 RepID=UPI0034563E16
MMAVESHCNLPYSEGVADTHNYTQGWIPDNTTYNTTDDVCTENLVPSDATRSPTYSHCDDGQEMWKYTFVSFANGFPYVGQHGIYRGGGYVASLGTSNQSSSNITAYLQQHSWLDNQTRAVFIEVTLYNPHVDLFSVFSIAVELTNTGGVYRSSEAVTLRLRQHDAVLLLVLRGFLALFLVYFAFTEAKKLFVRPLDYVIEVWNWMELFIVALGCSTLGVYLYTQGIIDVVSEQNAVGNSAFDQYKVAADWFQVYTYLLGLLICCITLKFLRILRFNSHVYALSMTMKKSFKPVAQFMAMAGVVVVALTMMANLVFGIKLESFIDIPTSLQSLLLMMLGSFDFESLSEGNRVLGPLMFFSYQVMMQFILLSMFMTIIMDVNAQQGDQTPPDDVKFVSFIREKASEASVKAKAIPSGIRSFESNSQDTSPDMLENVGHGLDRLDRYSARYDSTL